MPAGPGHRFYDALNGLLGDAGFPGGGGRGAHGADCAAAGRRHRSAAASSRPRARRSSRSGSRSRAPRGRAKVPAVSSTSGPCCSPTDSPTDSRSDKQGVMPHDQAETCTQLDEVLGAVMRNYELPGKTIARVWDRSWPLGAHRKYEGLAVEVAIPRGGMCEYGLLGGRTLQGRRGACTISVARAGDRWSGSLVEGVDEVRAALPAEFHEAVLLGAKRAMSDSDLADGIDFDCVCHGSVGSSPELFGRLAASVVHILADPRLLRDERRLTRILEDLRVV